MTTLRSPFPAVAGLAWLLAAAAIATIAPAEARASLFAGWALSGITGTLTFGLLALAEGRRFPIFLKAMLAGFGARLVLVGAGVLWMLRRGYNPLWFCLSFFALYWIFFACEYLAVQRALRVTPASNLVPNEVAP